MVPNDVFSGGCLCGAVRYEARGRPLRIGLCHCGDCRKATGCHAMPYGDWPPGAVHVTGPLATHAGRSFCPTCGSRLIHRSEAHDEVMLGTLDEAPFGLVPEVEGWTIRREPWQHPVAGAAQHGRDPT